MIEIFERLPVQTLTTFRRLVVIGIIAILLTYWTFFRALYHDYFPLYNDCLVYNTEQSTLNIMVYRAFAAFCPFIVFDQYKIFEKQDTCKDVLSRYNDARFATEIDYDALREDYDDLLSEFASIFGGDYFHEKHISQVYHNASLQNDVMISNQTAVAQYFFDDGSDDDIKIINRLLAYTTSHKDYQFFITGGIESSFSQYYRQFLKRILTSPSQKPQPTTSQTTPPNHITFTLHDIKQQLTAIRHNTTTSPSPFEFSVIDYIEYLSELNEYHLRYNTSTTISLELAPEQTNSFSTEGRVLPLPTLLVSTRVQYTTFIDLVVLVYIAFKLFLVTMQLFVRMYYFLNIIKLGNITVAFRTRRDEMNRVGQLIFNGPFYKAHLLLGQISLHLFKFSILITIFPILCSPRPILSYATTSIMISTIQYAITTLIAVSESEFLMREYYAIVDANSFNYAMESRMTPDEAKNYTIELLFGWLTIWKLLLSLQKKHKEQITIKHQNNSCDVNSDPAHGEALCDWLDHVTHMTCGICLLDYEYENDVILLPCLHIFHSACLAQWLNKKGACPVCLALIRTKNQADTASLAAAPHTDDVNTLPIHHVTQNAQSSALSTIKPTNKIITMSDLKSNYSYFFLAEYASLFHHYNAQFVDHLNTLPAGVNLTDDGDEDASEGEDYLLGAVTARATAFGPSQSHDGLARATSTTSWNDMSTNTDSPWTEEIMTEMMNKFTQLFLLKHGLHPSQKKIEDIVDDSDKNMSDVENTEQILEECDQSDKLGLSDNHYDSLNELSTLTHRATHTNRSL